MLGDNLEQRLCGNWAPFVPGDAGRKQLGLLKKHNKRKKKGEK